MKRLICIALATASLAGCVVVPAAPGYGHSYPRYVEPPVVVVPPYRGYGPRWDRDRDRGDWGRGHRW